LLLKIVLLGYAKGIHSNRKLAEACCRNVQFMALTADTRPHFTTLADFVTKMHQEVAGVFAGVSGSCESTGLRRFVRRAKDKVDAQRKRTASVHNVEKIGPQLAA
jgi:transposase